SSGHAAVIDRVGVEFADFRHQLKRRLRCVVLRPVVEEELHLREVFLLPRDESIVIARRDRFGGVSSQTVSPWSVLRENARSPGKHSLATGPSCAAAARRFVSGFLCRKKRTSGSVPPRVP